MYWNSLSEHLRSQYGGKVYKLALSSGCTCPNRDGTLGDRGCIFCDGAGALAAAGDIPSQLAAAKARVVAKAGPNARYIAYFQSFTNTYGPVDRLRALYTAAMAPPEVAVLSIATRPDCLGPEVLSLLAELNRSKPVWVELGLQTIHPGLRPGGSGSAGRRRHCGGPSDPGPAGGDAGRYGGNRTIYWRFRRKWYQISLAPCAAGH